MARKSRRFVRTMGTSGNMLPQLLDTLTKNQLRDILLHFEDVNPSLIVEALEEFWYAWYGIHLDEDLPDSLYRE